MRLLGSEGVEPVPVHGGERARSRAEDSAIEEDRQLAIGLGDLRELHGDRSEWP